MGAKQGEQYRVIVLALAEGTRSPKINGQTVQINEYTSTFQDGDGTTLIVTDRVGDVVTASENVAYPRGKNADYRNVAWIDEHAERFELIAAAPSPDPEPEPEPDPEP